MGSFTTSITEFSDSENRRTYSVSGHTVQAPKLLIQKRTVPKTTASACESALSVVYGTADAEGSPLATKVNLSASVRYPANGQSADVTAALAVFRDFVASDEFTNMVTSQDYVL
jgi:hypothetical protein